MKDIVILDGFRTPYAKAGTAFKDVPAVDLGAAVTKEVMARTGIDREIIDEVIIGNAGMPAEAANIARVIALRAGLPERIPAYSVQRNCASGMQAAASAYAQIVAGMSEIVLVGGVESMSNYAYYIKKKLRDIITTVQRAKTFGAMARAILSLRPKDFIPVVGLIEGLTDPISGLIMGETAEVLVRDFGITRREQDELALISHRRWTAANEAGKFKNEIIPFYVPPKLEAVEEDVGPRKNQTMEALEKLPSYFDKRYGTVTAGNSSPITDGAAAALIMSADKAKELGHKPLGTIKAVAFAGFDPSRMGISPLYATHKVLKLTGMKMKDIDLIELNEAFAAQGLVCLRQLGVADDAEHVNPHGGAIALGHPLGMSGARLALTAVHGLEKRGGKLALATLCVGVGQGVSLALERV
jgi:acetyl-CoA C-acetyltransferase/acetyl-CoA acyltransferase